MTDSNLYFNHILQHVQKERNIDFSGYRPKLLERRVMTRVRAVKLKTFEEYFRHLKNQSSEMDALIDVLTINVTEFFRDPKVFDAIAEQVLPTLLANKKADHQLNVWSCACSTGEEIYSIMMLFAEQLGDQFPKYHFKVMGTDIDQRVLVYARTGIYDVASLQKLTPHHQDILFRNVDCLNEKKIQVQSRFTSLVQFESHNIVRDEPLTKMDLILCRNLFIYLSREVQNTVLKKFAQALVPGGFLVLGNVESLSDEVRPYFDEVAGKERIFVKREAS